MLKPLGEPKIGYLSASFGMLRTPKVVFAQEDWPARYVFSHISRNRLLNTTVVNGLKTLAL